MMTRKEAINVLKNEIQCVLRDSCERSECASCDLVMPIERILSAYDMAIAALQEQEERENKMPLTLEEVKRINNEPVWVCFFGGAIAREDGWFILIDNGEYEYEVLLRGKESCYKSYNYYGKTWIAYKNRPKEET